MIISRLPHGSGGAANITKMITINGGIGEVINIIGEGLNDTVILDSTGSSSYILIAKKDTLVKFIGALSGYEKRIAVTDPEDVVVNVFNENQLYWYGRKTDEWNFPYLDDNKIRSNSNAGQSYYEFDIQATEKSVIAIRTKNQNDLALKTATIKTFEAIASMYTSVDVTNLTNILVEVDVKNLSPFGKLFMGCFTFSPGTTYWYLHQRTYLAQQFYDIPETGKIVLSLDVRNISGIVCFQVGNTQIIGSNASTISSTYVYENEYAISKIWGE